MITIKNSEIISSFLKLIDSVSKEYQIAFDMVGEKDKETIDFMHEVELKKLKQNEKAKMMTRLVEIRKERRYWKNKVDEYQSLNELLNDKEFKKTIEQLKQVLGKVRKAENYLEDREYKPRVKKGGIAMETENNVNKKTYEFGLIVGTKREREYWEKKIKEKVEAIKENFEEGYSLANQGKLDILEELLKGE